MDLHEEIQRLRHERWYRADVIDSQEILPRCNEGTHRSGAWLVLSSLAAFPGLVARHSLRLRTERVGCSYHLFDGHSYRVFRETTRPLGDVPRTVIEVGFRLKVIRSAAVPHWLFQRLCILTTPCWSGFDGFGTKLWMVDPGTHSYAGIYEWGGSTAAQRYLDVLLAILRAVSTKGSVVCKVHSDTELTAFTDERRAD
jgi:hypothetical protein